LAPGTFGHGRGFLLKCAFPHNRVFGGGDSFQRTSAVNATTEYEAFRNRQSHRAFAFAGHPHH
jgi:hypothetical protein